MLKKLFSAILFSLAFTPSYSIAEVEKAVFAGGCFWCMEAPFEKLKGVQSVVSGYIGGEKKNPTYKEVSSGASGHIEAVQVTFDNKLVSYDDLLKTYWKNIDPLDPSGQFCDKGEQYQSGIFFLNNQQKDAAEKSLLNHQKDSRFKGKKIVTFIKSASVFYEAEDYHQDYYKKNPVRYKFYRYNCGRDKRLEEVWK
jgi:methionine-S-sulfoxide reductase